MDYVYIRVQVQPPNISNQPLCWQKTTKKPAPYRAKPHSPLHLHQLPLPKVLPPAPLPPAALQAFFAAIERRRTPPQHSAHPHVPDQDGARHALRWEPEALPGVWVAPSGRVQRQSASSARENGSLRRCWKACTNSAGLVFQSFAHTCSFKTLIRPQFIQVALLDQDLERDAV